jgi:hypothetical protein
MTLEMQQIKDSYEKLGMSPMDIAENRRLEVEAVKMALMSASSRYRKDCGIEDKTGEVITKESRNFSDEQLEAVNQRIYDLAMGSDNDAVSAKLCMYVRDDSLGRLDVAKGLAGAALDVLAISESLRRDFERANQLIYGQREPKQLNSIPA